MSIVEVTLNCLATIILRISAGRELYLTRFVSRNLAESRNSTNFKPATGSTTNSLVVPDLTSSPVV